MGKWQELINKGDVAPGKLFLIEELGMNLTCMNASVNALKPGSLSFPYLHKHVHHEELYVFIHGKGEMRLGEEVVNVSEGDLVRVAPPLARAVRNPMNNREELWFICFRASDGQFTPIDQGGGPVPGVVGWSEPS